MSTPRTDAAEEESIRAYEKEREPGWPPFPCDGYDFARQLERELEEARKHAETCQSCHSIGIQLDLIRDELKRIEARILESRFSDDPHLSNILDYCRRSQLDIATSYSLIVERDRLEAENRKLKINLEDQLTSAKTALEKAWKVFKDVTKEEAQLDSETRFQQYLDDWDEAKAAINEVLKEEKK